MLVLTRRLGEVIFIGPDISVTVVDIDRGKIRLGIDAPQHIKVMRRELLDAEQRKAEEAAGG